ncbi:Uma2 family endonuclease [Alkalinema sp. FACHB-956]|uniref:Uma2 family endonuclease n=1 Tax=Alkalinema sp. FACHB-956 TaxID=2692768 RepID=UPI0016824D69|nr:Uma2 family endonuclease [Alkalinema sp. FACHB-956]MBD2329753.1 Uma2 family endonuclease [Alkalinema sp. FACHB-956]
MVISPKITSPTEPDSVIYPDSDGQPMADNTKQFEWIVLLKKNLDILFAEDANVFVAGDLLWYPLQGRNQRRTAPDVMVVFGRPKGERGSYKQWEEDNIAPQVVFEILSPSNTIEEMERKLLFYDRYGVEEYYIYDPETGHFRGWLRGEEGLDGVEFETEWVSPRLEIRFDCSGDNLQVFYPSGLRFLSQTELAAQLEQTNQALEQTSQELEQEKARSQRLAEKLRELGIDPDTLER